MKVTKQLLFLLAFIAGFFLSKQNLYAQACTVSISPATGDLSTTFSVSVSGCPNGRWRIIVTQAGNDIDNREAVVEGGVLRSPFFFRASEPGSITVILGDLSGNEFGSSSVEIGSGNPPPPAGQFKCGDIVPLDSTGRIEADPCPQSCPMTNQDNMGNTIPYYCRCGTLNTPVCPDGNGMGMPTCANDTLVVVGGVCRSDQEVTVFEGTCNGGTGIDSAIGCIPFNTLSGLGGFFLSWGLGIGGGIGFLSLIGATFMIMASSGDPSKIQAAKVLFISSISGLAVLILSGFILRVIGVNILGLFS